MESSPHPKALLMGVAQSYKRLFQYLSPYRRRFFGGLLTALLAGMSSTALMAVLTLVSKLVLGGELNFAQKVPFLGSVDFTPWIQQWWPDGDWRTFGRVAAVCAVIPAFMALRGLTDFLANYQLTWVQQRLSLDLQRAVFTRIMARSLEFFNKQRSAELIQTAFGMTSTCAATAMTLAQDLVRRPAAVISTLVYLTIKDPVFMAFSLVVFPLCMLPVLLLRKRVLRSAKTEQEQGAKISGIVMESISGIRVVKSHAREAFEIERFTSAARDVNSTSMRIYRMVEIVGPLVETTASLGIAGGLVYCWWRGVRFDDFSFRVGLLVLLYPDVKALSRMGMVIQRCTTASDQVFKMLDERSEIENVSGAIRIERAKGALTFENVTYAYRPGAAPAVKGLSLQFEPGKFYALVGESGAGKSTLMSLILRFYDPQQGRILLDGTDLRDIHQTSLRQQMGIVNQDLFLFHDTIENNIRYGRLDATLEEIREAAKIARADEFIMKQPQGYQTLVGDKGCNLSGGQLQRVTIARAVLRNSPILLLDEATSNLDTDTEQAFKDALRVLRRDRTVVAIAHRFSTILEADQIVVMDQGSVVDLGTHAELVERCAMYERLFRLQFTVGDVVTETPATPASQRT
jgi:ABC-type multidrug transport system fused ATPase/permease subunit